MAYDDSATGKRPAIFMVHARNGLTDFAKQQAEEWSKLGYYVFATDMFGMLPKNPRGDHRADRYVPQGSHRS